MYPKWTFFFFFFKIPKLRLSKVIQLKWKKKNWTCMDFCGSDHLTIEIKQSSYIDAQWKVNALIYYQGILKLFVLYRLHKTSFIPHHSDDMPIKCFNQENNKTIFARSECQNNKWPHKWKETHSTKILLWQKLIVCKHMY